MSPRRSAIVSSPQCSPPPSPFLSLVCVFSGRAERLPASPPWGEQGTPEAGLLSSSTCLSLKVCSSLHSGLFLWTSHLSGTDPSSFPAGLGCLLQSDCLSHWLCSELGPSVNSISTSRYRVFLHLGSRFVSADCNSHSNVHKHLFAPLALHLELPPPWKINEGDQSEVSLKCVF